MDNTLALVALVVALVGVFLFSTWLAHWRARRAAGRIIRVFIDREAIGPGAARSVEDLGLSGRRSYLLRDYTTLALAALVRSEVVRQTEDGRLYLDEKVAAEHISSIL